MPSAPPDGEPVPASGALPPAALAGRDSRPLGFYLHVPYCATRCGYCDFNTYTASELRGASREDYAATLAGEIRLARRVLGDDPRPAATVFVGGGTPTLLPPEDLGAMLASVREEFGLAPDAEITTEANPESVTPRSLEQLRAAGFNRISFGMQSARPHVLRILDRTHTPGRPEQCVAEARAAGFEHVNLDLIYGTPGESDEDWRASLDAALSAGPDHISAYALIVEDGTQLARRIRRGEIPAPDDDVHADRYLMAEETLSAAGLHWYEVSNWARGSADSAHGDGARGEGAHGEAARGGPAAAGPAAAGAAAGGAARAARCRHNELYWTGADWWGAGPGAHSHVGGVRWWNVKHPAAYGRALAEGRSPGAGRELLTAEDRRVERILLELRLAAGCPLSLLAADGEKAAQQALSNGLLQPGPYAEGCAVLTLRGRLLADAVVRDLVD